MIRHRLEACATLALLAAVALSMPAAAKSIATGPATTPFVPPANVIEASPPPTVGTEGRLDVVLPFDDVVPAVAGSKADLVVRVAGKRPWGTGWRYDVRWVAAAPGSYDLTKHLRRDGQPDAPLAIRPMTVLAKGVLPDAHDGSLGDVNKSPVGGTRWYWPVAIALAAAWVLLLVPLVRRRLRRRPAVQDASPAAPPTLAERLRPLVAAAAAGTLDAEGQGRLERLLLHVWRRRLVLAAVPPAQAVGRMKAHPEAGQILRAMEDWLHRPPGGPRPDEAELGRLLAPYADVPDVEDVAGEVR